MVACSTEDVVCLSLAETVTESGVATTSALLDALGVEESTIGGHFEVISALSALEDRGDIETRSETLASDGRGEAGERTVYELTESGQDRAEAVAADLADQSVTVLTAEGREEQPLGEAAEQFGGSLAETVARLQDGMLVVDEDVGDPVDPEAMPFVGREAELAWLTERFERVRSAADGRTDESDAADGRTDECDAATVVRVEGESGLGKTFLAREFGERISDRGALVLTGQTGAETGVPYAAFLDAVDALPAGPRERIEDALSPSNAEASAPSDPDELAERRGTAFATVVDGFEAVVAERPVVLVLDDAQWVDRPTALLVAHVAEALADEPFLVMATSYPEATEPEDPLRNAVAESDCRAERRPLDPFDEEATGELVARLVGTRGVPASFVERIHDHTGGHPQFVVETVTRLLEIGLVRPEAGVYPEADEDVPVPESVEAAIRARLAGLDTGTRDVLETAALVGTVVPERVLLGACPLDPAAVRNRIEVLSESRLWVRGDDSGEGVGEGTVGGDENAAAGDDGTVRFVSDAVRQTVRNGVDPERRERLDRRIARAYEELGEGAGGESGEGAGGESGEESSEYAAAAAHHYDRAGMAEEALDASLAAAEYATDVFAHEVAVDACERAVELARAVGDDEALVEALEFLGDTYVVVGELDEARRCFRYVRENATATDAVQRAHYNEANIARKRDEYDAARDHLERSLALAEETGDRSAEGRSLNGLGFLARIQGAYDDAREYHERALDAFEAVGDRRGLAQSHSGVGAVVMHEGDLPTAREQFERALELFRDTGQRWSEATVRNNLGIVAFEQGDLDAAGEHYERALALAREFDDRHEEAGRLMNLALVVQAQGDLETAREYHERALELFRELGDGRGEAKCLTHFGELARLRGDLERATERYEDSLALFGEVGDRDGQARCYRDLSAVARYRHDLEQAREYYEEALGAFRDLGDRHNEARCLRGLGAVALDRGDLDRARERLDACLETFREIGDREGEASTVGLLGAVAARSESDADADADADARDRLEEALSTHREVGDQQGELELFVHHVEAALATGADARARELCDRARDRLAALDGGAPLWRDRIETLCSRVDEGSPTW